MHGLPSIAAVHDGYQVFAVIDASGTYSKMAQEITLARVVQAGVVPMDTAAVCSEIQRTWNRDDAVQFAEAYSAVFPHYQLLIESYARPRPWSTTTSNWIRSASDPWEGRGCTPFFCRAGAWWTATTTDRTHA